MFKGTILVGLLSVKMCSFWSLPFFALIVWCNAKQFKCFDHRSYDLNMVFALENADFYDG